MRAEIPFSSPMSNIWFEDNLPYKKTYPKGRMNQLGKEHINADNVKSINEREKFDYLTIDSFILFIFSMGVGSFIVNCKNFAIIYSMKVVIFPLIVFRIS